MIDTGSVTELFSLHAARLVLYARQWLDRAAAEDVVHDVFVALLSQRREPAEVKAWLYRAVRNAAISRLRSRFRRRRREQRVAETRGGWFESGADDLIDARSAEDALQRLPQEQREIVILRIWAGMGFAEIAELTGSSVSTVHDRYRAALTAVRRVLEESRCPNRNP